MQQVRVVLVGVAPFLADLIRQIVAARSGAGRLSIEDIAASAADPGGPPPAIVILGPDAAAPWTGSRLPPPSRILRLSSDLATLLGPGPATSAPLTPDVLAERLFEIARTI